MAIDPQALAARAAGSADHHHCRDRGDAGGRALVLRLVRPLVLPLLPDTASQTVFALIETVSQMSLWFALLNLWPIPCLTGCLWLDAGCSAGLA